MTIIYDTPNNRQSEDVRNREEFDQGIENNLVSSSLETGLSKSELVFEFFSQFIERNERHYGNDDKFRFRKYFPITNDGEIKWQ